MDALGTTDPLVTVLQAVTSYGALAAGDSVVVSVTVLPLAEIAAKIYDKNDNSGITGVVDYADYLSNPAVEHSSWGAIKALFSD